MPPTLRYGPLKSPQELEQLGRILTQCFNFPANTWGPWSATLGGENLRRVVRGGEVVGGLGILFMGQWFGGRNVSTGGIAAVGVPPEHRTGGLAHELMVQTLRELRRRRVPLSTLYPATQRLYRKSGYELAGTFCRHRVAAAAIGRMERALAVTRVVPGEHEIFHAPYRERARLGNGNLDRNEAMWRRLGWQRDDPVFAYTFGAPEEPEGYVVFAQQKAESRLSLQVRDLVALTPKAATTAWAFLAGHRSMVREIFWPGPAVDPLTFLLPEQDVALATEERWFLRIVDVERALSARGYPAGLEAELSLDVRDEVLPENHGRFHLQVWGGAGEARSEKKRRPAKTAPRLRLHVRALASLYSGFLTPAELHAIGLLDGPPAALAAAARIFAGPAPWMPDGF